jgi:amidase
MARNTVSAADGHVYEFTPALEPVYTAADGESLTVETVDSLEGAIQTPDDHLASVPEEVNAATGPIAVEGAVPGDVLRVDVDDVRLAEPHGRVVTTPGFGLLQDHPEIDHPATRITEVDADGETIDFEGVGIPVDPVIGTIGVATESESISTLIPHDHGGNLDTTDITTGATVYVPVFQPGGLLALGDAKAAMADGEMCGTGAEIATEVDLTLSVVSDPAVSLSRPLVETAEHWKTIASAETMEDAVRRANEDLLALLAREHDFSLTEAYLFSSLVGGLEISQVVDPLVTVRNACPREYLSDPL